MDPITHGVIGLAISTFSGRPVTLDNPYAIGAAIGAMVPDMDFVVRFLKNDMVYLKTHRGPSHSVPALALSALLIAGMLTYLMPESGSLFAIWFWTFLGGLSHTVFDILNSYGAMLFDRKLKANLLTLYDPVITLIAVHLIALGASSPILRVMDALLFAGYLLFRVHQRRVAKNHLMHYFSMDYKDVDVAVLPSLKVFYKWDFIVSTRSHSVVGTYGGALGGIKVLKRFPNVGNDYLEAFGQSNVGRYFKDWTPHYHLEATTHADHVQLKAIDLRYHFRDEFMHHATLILEHDHRVREAFVHPYRYSKRIRVVEAC